MRSSRNRRLVLVPLLAIVAVGGEAFGIDPKFKQEPIAFYVTRVKISSYRDFKHPKSAESPDRKVILRVDPVRSNSCVRLYDKATEKPLGPSIRVGRVSALAVASNNRTIAIGSTWSDGGGGVEVWDAVTGTKVAEWSSGEVVDVSFEADKKTTHARVVNIRCGPEPRS